MIRLICSDMDGTLIPYGHKNALDEELFDLIRALAARGVLFCPASGRQYTSLRKLFAPVAEHCAFLCENGAVIFYKEQVLAKTALPRAQAEQIAWDMWRNSGEKGEVMLSGENTAYLMSRGRGMADRIRQIGNRHVLITDPAQIPEDITKVSLYIREGVAPYVDYFVPKWKAFNAAVAGPLWIDTTLSNKGTGLRALCERMGLDPAQTMAFGDNYNDVAMLDLAGQGYIMDTAAPELLARYPLHTSDPRVTLRALWATLS